MAQPRRRASFAGVRSHRERQKSADERRLGSAWRTTTHALPPNGACVLATAAPCLTSAARCATVAAQSPRATTSSRTAVGRFRDDSSPRACRGVSLWGANLGGYSDGTRRIPGRCWRTVGPRRQPRRAARRTRRRVRTAMADAWCHDPCLPRIMSNEHPQSRDQLCCSAERAAPLADRGTRGARPMGAATLPQRLRSRPTPTAGRPATLPSGAARVSDGGGQRRDGEPFAHSSAMVRWRGGDGSVGAQRRELSPNRPGVPRDWTIRPRRRATSASDFHQSSVKHDLHYLRRNESSFAEGAYDSPPRAPRSLIPFSSPPTRTADARGSRHRRLGVTALRRASRETIEIGLAGGTVARCFNGV